MPDKYNKRHLKLPIIKEKVVFEEMTARCIHFTHKNAYYNTQTRTLSVTITEKLTLGPLEKKIPPDRQFLLFIYCCGFLRRKQGNSTSSC